jgi:hypothetical protein
MTALLVPVAALTVARLSRSSWWHRGIAAALLSLAFIRTATVGSLSPSALHDPPFWAVLAAVALGVSLAARRWPLAVATAACIGGAFAMAATLVSMVPALDRGYLVVIQESLTALRHQIGVVALIALLGAWLHAIGAGWRDTSRGPVHRTASGALLAALIFVLVGVPPSENGLGNVSVLALGALLGLAEAKPIRS